MCEITPFGIYCKPCCCSDLIDVTGIAVILPVIFYEPLFITFKGQTPGHRLNGLLVRDKQGINKLNIIRSTLRFIAKLALGLPSFFFVFTTKNHQALHDLITRAIVINDSKVSLPHYEQLSARAPLGSNESLASPPKRIFMIVLYSAISLILLFLATNLLLTPNCISLDQCTPSDQIILDATGFFWLLLPGLIMITGWRGKLPFCKN
ncbi:RDD family protein [Endozoicomonas sp. Mp262]|uniref:RDD family protein n=1 Tax=Endozoicomonas sp. Mp262 TaxID=2919499 RepID=UPI0021DA5306